VVEKTEQSRMLTQLRSTRSSIRIEKGENPFGPHQFDMPEESEPVEEKPRRPIVTGHACTECGRIITREGGSIDLCRGRIVFCDRCRDVNNTNTD
jgi:hypothetical protein